MDVVGQLNKMNISVWVSSTIQSINVRHSRVESWEGMGIPAMMPSCLGGPGGFQVEVLAQEIHDYLYDLNNTGQASIQPRPQDRHQPLIYVPCSSSPLPCHLWALTWGAGDRTS